MDVKRVENTLKRYDWFQEKGYHPAFPAGIDPNRSGEISRVDIEKAVRAEWDETEYRSKEHDLVTLWPRVISEAKPRLGKTDLRPLDSYTVLFVKYGTNGSYQPPEKVVLNLRYRYDIGLAKTVFHEIVHLMIHPYIEQYQISHWSKERIVDRLVDKLVPHLSKIKNLPINTTAIDEIFDARYPRVAELIKKVGAVEIENSNKA